MNVWLNGEFVGADEARLSVFDAGVQHAIGLFETFGARNGRVFRARAHTDRLVESSRELLLTDRLRAKPLADAVQHALEHSGLESARLRLTVTGGALDRLRDRAAQPPDPSVLIVAQPPTVYPPRFFEEGIGVGITPARANPFDPLAGHKTLAYWPRILELQRTAPSGASEALWFSVSNHLASGSVSNVFLVTDGSLRTPYARGEEPEGTPRSPVLPGITRSAVIECAGADEIDVRREMLTIADLLGADEVFLTNSSWGVLPVVRVEDETIGDGAVGPVTHQMREAWDALVEAETSA